MINLQGTVFKTLKELTIWEKCYWYLRMLIDTNRFGALAKSNKKLEKLYVDLLNTYKLINLDNSSEDEKLKILNSVLKQNLLEKLNDSKERTKKSLAHESLIVELEKFLVNPIDYFIFGFVIRELLIPTNQAVEKVPSSESTDFAKKFAKAILDVKKENGLSTLIRDWDMLTEVISINKERDIIVELFRKIKKDFKNNLLSFFDTNSNLNKFFVEEDMDIILTSLCQEYERRVSQKRKQRAGNDMESGIEFILNYFNIKTSGSPEHFTTGLEVDNWIKDKKGWYIGISLKRTLRERWKQTYTTETGLYDRYKIKHILHIINNDMDLSDSKVTELGAYRHLFFLADNSNILKEMSQHIALKKYVFPMSSLINKIKELQQN